ncbi:hypothetical protein L208DRAFT_1417191 [Tricholoma matsutake]|nr:hypothetical protein L208DRAFT_1417191 [Tricholoma matsutake 945]
MRYLQAIATHPLNSPHLAADRSCISQQQMKSSNWPFSVGICFTWSSTCDGRVLINLPTGSN